MSVPSSAPSFLGSAVPDAVLVVAVGRVGIGSVTVAEPGLALARGTNGRRRLRAGCSDQRSARDFVGATDESSANAAVMVNVAGDASRRAALANVAGTCGRSTAAATGFGGPSVARMPVLGPFEVD